MPEVKEEQEAVEAAKVRLVDRRISNLCDVLLGDSLEKVGEGNDTTHVYNDAKFLDLLAGNDLGFVWLSEYRALISTTAALAEAREVIAAVIESIELDRTIIKDGQSALADDSLAALAITLRAFLAKHPAKGEE